MKKALLFSLVIIAILLGTSIPVAAQTPVGGPPYGWQAHPPIHARPYASSSPSGLTPNQIRAAYGFNTLSETGAGQTIAIIDAYDAPTIENDLQIFIKQFGGGMTILPAGTSKVGTSGDEPWFQKIYAQGSQPRSNSGWALEASLDVEWAHAIAPQANIILVEAASNSFQDLMGAVDKAVALGADVVSMSWGGSEFSSESNYDTSFQAPGVVFTASSGDSGAGTSFPAASPYVLGVGGTTLTLGSNGVWTETAWSGSGGGVSKYESAPTYQSSYFSFKYTDRGIPDVSYDADPSSGVPVYDSTKYYGQSGWWVVGGTSAGAPQWAALIALVNQSRGSNLSGNDLIYTAASGTDYSTNYRDIQTGSNGFPAETGYDLVTGVGSPIANNLVPFLVSGTTATPSPDFSLSVTPSSQSVTQGSSTTYTIDVNPSGGFSDTVSFDASNLPTGVSASFSLNPSTSSTLTVTTSSNTPAGIYTITINGTSGSLEHSVTADLTVTNPSTSTTASFAPVMYSTFGGKNHDSNLSITLSLFDSLGSPVANASVSIRVDLGVSLYGSGTGTTGSTGSVTFNINHAPSGTYTVTVTGVTPSNVNWDGVQPSNNSYTK